VTIFRQILVVTAAIAAFLHPGRLTSAHEHTWSAYAGSLRQASKGLSEADHPGVSESQALCRLTLNLVDFQSREPVDGLVRVKRADASVVEVNELFNRGTMLRRNHPGKDWHVLLGSATISVPQQELTVDAISGLEAELASATIDLTGKEAAQFSLHLKRFCSAAAPGWHSGNTHLHLRSLTRQQADEYLQSIARADGLELVFVSFLRRAKAEATYISNSYTREELNALSGHGVLFDNGEEHRHNFGPGGEGYGHVMFLNIRELIRPVSIGPGIMNDGTDWPSIRHGIDRAHRDGATAVWCHNAWGLEDVPNWVTGALDAHNIFDGGSRGDYADSFYRFMDVGLHVPFSTGTDWFIYDFARVYVRLDGPVTVPRWLDALRQGRSFITNGPLLEFEVEGHEPGDVIRVERPRSLTIRGKATGRRDFQSIELVQNGQVLTDAPSRRIDGHFEAEFKTSVSVDEPGWVAMRVRSDHTSELGEPLFGHTSAVYIELAGESIFKRRAAAALISDMREAIATIDEKAHFGTDDERKQVLNVYRQGIQALRERLGNE
jgi:hypothetical protein